ncbi:hypothetical protein HRbin39_00963 [bacterium HR39]|nr:hypothetical protein HRbin39_00963 [bacterium HR39]
MEPAQERLHPHHLAAREVHLGLVVDHELGLLEGPPQAAFQHQPLEGGRVHVGGVEAKLAAPLFFGPRQRRVGVLHEALRIGAVVRPQGDADAGGDGQLLAVHPEGRAQGVEHLLGDAGGGLGAGDPVQHQQELVAARPRHRVGTPQGRAQPLGDRPQQRVAGAQAEGVVDQLEAVEIDQHHRQHLTVAPRPLDGLAEAVERQQAVGQTGERVVVGERPDGLLGLAADGDVAHGDGEATRRPVDAGDAQLKRHQLAVAAPPGHLGVAERSVGELPAQLLEVEGMLAGRLQQVGQRPPHHLLEGAGEDHLGRLVAPAHEAGVVHRHHPVRHRPEHGQQPRLAAAGTQRLHRHRLGEEARRRLGETGHRRRRTHQQQHVAGIHRRRHHLVGPLGLGDRQRPLLAHRLVAGERPVHEIEPALGEIGGQRRGEVRAHAGAQPVGQRRRGFRRGPQQPSVLAHQQHLGVEQPRHQPRAAAGRLRIRRLLRRDGLQQADRPLHQLALPDQRHGAVADRVQRAVRCHQGELGLDRFAAHEPLQAGEQPPAALRRHELEGREIGGGVDAEAGRPVGTPPHGPQAPFGVEGEEIGDGREQPLQGAQLRLGREGAGQHRALALHRCEPQHAQPAPHRQRFGPRPHEPAGAVAGGEPQRALEALAAAAGLAQGGVGGVARAARPQHAQAAPREILEFPSQPGAGGGVDVEDGERPGLAHAQEDRRYLAAVEYGRDRRILQSHRRFRPRHSVAGPVGALREDDRGPTGRCTRIRLLLPTRARRKRQTRSRSRSTSPRNLRTRDACVPRESAGMADHCRASPCPSRRGRAGPDSKPAAADPK